SNIPMARDTYCIRLHVPELAKTIRPGQFFMIRMPGTPDPLLGRPFALFDTVLDNNGDPAAIEVGYLVVGKLTRLLTALRQADTIEVWGPLGNGFPDLQAVEHLGLV